MPAPRFRSGSCTKGPHSESVISSIPIEIHSNLRPRRSLRKVESDRRSAPRSASWNNEYFNQGSPKPNGTRPGLTTPVSGSYDAATNAFVLTWSSQVVGGPFNGFTGYWHLVGTFVPHT